MARFAIISPEGVGLSWWRRLHDEGHQVLVYIVAGKNGKDPLSMRHVGDGLIPKTDNLSELLAWAKEKPSIAFFDSASTNPGMVRGHIAERFIQANVLVIGGGMVCDRLEEDRLFGERVAQSLGCPIPNTKSFSTISQTMEFAKSTDEAWYFKPDRYLEGDTTQGCKDGERLYSYLSYVRKQFGDRIPNILQEHISGVALSTACWFNGTEFVPPYEGTIEHKKFLNDDLGPAHGCAVNAVWFYDEETPKIVKELGWEHLAGLLRKYKCPPVLVDINAQISEVDGRPYFLEWTVRNGWDSEAISHRLFDGDLGTILEGLATGKLSGLPVTSDIAYGIRLTIPPYPWEHGEGGKFSSIGVPVLGADGLWEGHFIGYAVKAGEEYLEVADRTGMVGVGTGTGRSLKKIHDDVITYLQDEFWVKGLQYRSDGAKVIGADAERIRGLGFPVKKGV